VRKLFIASIGIALLTITVLFATKILAYHVIYTAADTNAQWVTPTAYENFAFESWATTLGPSGDDMVYWVVDSGLESDVEDAVEEWELVIPELTWAEGDENNWNVKIYFDDQCDIAATNVLVWNYDGDREANYWWQSYICVNPDDQLFASGARVAAIIHEMGHQYGLADRCYHPGGPAGYPEGFYACYNFATTSPEIMDGMKDNGQGLLITCDEIGYPYSNTDVLRAELYWSDGQFGYLAPEFCCGSVHTALFKWEDYVRAEYEHELHFFWWNGSQWVEYLWDDNIYQVGTHYAYNPGYIEYYIDRRDYEEVTAAGWHMLCGWAWFSKFNSTTDWECSSQIYLY